MGVMPTSAIKRRKLWSVLCSSSSDEVRSHSRATWHGSVRLETENAVCVPCGGRELVSGVHTVVAGVVQVYHRLQVLEEEEKGRKAEQEIEMEDQSEETAQMTMHMEME